MKLSSIIAALGLYISSSLAFEVEENWEISEYTKTIDVLKSYVKERHEIIARNIASEPVSEFYVILPESDDSIALNVIMLEYPKLSSPLLDSELVATEDGLSYYKLDINLPIAPKSEIKLLLSYILTDKLTPTVEEAKMGSTQYLQIHTVRDPLSCYKVQTYQLGLLGASEFEELSTKTEDFLEPVVSKDSIVFGPFVKEYPTNTVVPFHFSYKHDFPLPYIYNLERDYWISHWSDALQLEEYYELSNKAVKLDSGFSRVDWMQGHIPMTQSSVLTTVMIPLNKDVDTDAVYYTDKVGNVSTSAFVRGDLLLKPRFPIFGDWHYNFTIGWNNKLSQFAKKLEDKPDEYLLKVKLLDGLVDAVYENVQLSVHLPEGAEFIEAKAPFNWDKLTIDSEYSYLDISSGHTKVTFTFKNLVDEMRGLDLIVHYKYSTFDMFRKPLFTALYTFLALMALYVLRKVDLKIKPAEKKTKTN